MVGISADHVLNHARGALGGFQDRIVTVALAYDIERRKHNDAMLQARSFADDEARNRGNVGRDRQPRQAGGGAALREKKSTKTPRRTSRSIGTAMTPLRRNTAIISRAAPLRSII